MGVLHIDKLQASERPLADALNAAMGHGGGKLMALLALTSLFGSILGWILLSSEVPYQAAKEGFFLPSSQKQTKRKSNLFITINKHYVASVLILNIIRNNCGSLYIRYYCIDTGLPHSISRFTNLPVKTSRNW